MAYPYEQKVATHIFDAGFAASLPSNIKLPYQIRK
jgi:hypothetical protein